MQLIEAIQNSVQECFHMGHPFPALIDGDSSPFSKAFSALLT
ncbi:hypothetical protein BRO54_3317 [Geobacillus proteiniphilus]|uniref:Uncharacterized protein n=1 Tax=Geobacillus proteiniphilus TaxID=860353 RepID=A0A1Q5SNF2_9BACL|nr:hypothetical protein BRO54_3317 [Geobacillus proteiniphilus]